MSIGFKTEDGIATVAWKLSTHLLANGYLCYWKHIDALQVGPSTWYYQYSVNQVALATSLSSVFAAAKGMVTLRQDEGVEREFVVRATVAGAVPVGKYVPVPSIAIELSPVETGRPVELGSNVHNRSRRLQVYGLGRTVTEARWFTDNVPAWLDVNTVLTVKDYASGSGNTILATPQLEYPTIDTDSTLDDAEVVTYEWLYTATLRYEA